MQCSGFPPQIHPTCQVLILGSMPGKASLKQAQYYAHSRNAFWPICQALHHSVLPEQWPERYPWLWQLRIGLWDVLAQCHRVSSLDKDISQQGLSLNPLAATVQSLPQLQAIGFNGQKARQLFNQHCVKLEPQAFTHLALIDLPSTSPANAMISTAQKQIIWHQALKQYLDL